MGKLILLHSRVLAAVVVAFVVIAIASLGFLIYLAFRYHEVFMGYMKKKENEKEKEKALATLGSTSCSSRLDAANCSSNEMGEFRHFRGGEHLNAEVVLNAPGEVAGKTSYGTTYKATLGDGSMIALRLMRVEVIVGSSANIGTTFSSYIKSTIEEIGAIRHPNLVPLLAHYSGLSGERLLIYPFFPRRSLADLLHGGSNGTSSTMGWALRHKVLLGAAQGLAYLHHSLRRAHANIKSKNILVGHDYHGHVTNLGIEKLMNLATTQADMLPLSARLGYKAPELHTITKANPKSDIFSFGIVILEAITGKKPWISKGNPTLLKWSTLPSLVKCALVEERVEELFDTPILSELKSYWNNGCNGKEEVESEWELGLVEALQLGIACCAFSPHCRPDIGDVVKQLEAIGTRIANATLPHYPKLPFKTSLLPTSFNDQCHR